MTLQRIENSSFQVNTYLLIRDNEAVIVDPGEEFRLIEKQLADRSLTPVAIVNTHGHVDHVASAAQFREKYGIPFCLDSRDQYLLDHLESSCERYDLPYSGTPVIDRDLAGAESFDIADFHFDILHTPGHTPGSVCLRWENVLLTGDTLFYRSVGRSDFPGGKQSDLEHSIRDILYKLPESLPIHPGHGPSSSIGQEKFQNPFIRLIS